MEERTLDKNQIIGYVLIFGILLWLLYNSSKDKAEKLATEKAKQEQIDKENANTPAVVNDTVTKVVTPKEFNIEHASDSLKQIAYTNKLGAFAFSALNASNGKDEIVETEKFKLTFSNKGGYLKEVLLKEFTNYKKQPIYLIKDNNASFNINFGTTDSRILNTKDLNFEPTVTKNGDNTIVSMKLKTSNANYLEYRYEINPNDYMIDFALQSKGLSTVINSSQPINMSWDLKTYRQAKSIQYENRYTDLHYDYEDGKDDYLGQMEDEETIKDVTWIGYKQHFFTSVLLTDKAFKTAQLKTKNLVEDETIDTVFTKQYSATMPLTLQAGELNTTMDWYYGPSKLKALEKYDRNLDEIVPLGWGIFGVINKHFITPIFNLLIKFLPHGIAIIVLTIFIKFLMSFVQYKQFLSQAKMKILKPELEAIRQKYKNNKMKAQQETMALQSKAGASPMAGCLPALLQIPVFYALFMFFPSAFDLRGKSFLWADDLASFDSIADLPFSIPLYGDHVSLFPILASIAIFFYMKMTTGQQTAMQAPTQEGMPDMQKMMKYMIYFSPLLMLVFFNNYASGLSLYYFVSNLLSIGIMLVIKHYIIDEDKVLAKIEENKKKPKKENRFQRKMQQIMEQAEAQKQAQQKRKK